MVAKLTILVADCDRLYRLSLCQLLEKAGHEVLTAASASDALQALKGRPADIVITDLYLSNYQPEGLSILRQARHVRPGCEVIFTTATPRLDTAIQCLREGACDYLAKPVGDADMLASVQRVQERLLQRIQQEDALMTIETNLRKVLARAPSPAAATAANPVTAVAAPEPDTEPKQFRIGPVLLDLNRYQIEVGGQRISATTSEIQILGYLCRNPKRVVTPQELIRSLRGYTVEPRDAQETIRAHISNLRRKLAMAAPDADIIATVRSVGYSLKLPPQSST